MSPTPRALFLPSAQSIAQRMATRLTNVLARDHNIPADVYVFTPGEAIVSIYYGLVARTDGRGVWWLIPELLLDEKRRKCTYAWSVEAAAARLAQHYAVLIRRPPAELAERVKEIDRLSLATGPAPSPKTAAPCPR